MASAAWMHGVHRVAVSVASPGRAFSRRVCGSAALLLTIVTGCVRDVGIALPDARPPVTLDAQWVPHNGVPPSKLPGTYGKGVDAVAAMLLSACWGVSDTPLDMTVVCHETRLDAEQAELLAGNRFAVFLPRLRHLDPVAARALGSCSGVLELTVLETLDAESAALLAGRREILRLPALKQLDADAARGLMASACDINLDGLTHLEPGVAAALATHRGMLTLNGLVELSVDDARHLASHTGDLCLNGLQSLSPEAAMAFARFAHGLHLNGLKTLSVAAAAALGAHTGWCLSCNGLEERDERAIEAIARHPRSGATIALTCRMRRAAAVARQGAGASVTESRPALSANAPGGSLILQ